MLPFYALSQLAKFWIHHLSPADFHKIFLLTLPLLLFLSQREVVAACDTGVAYAPCQSAVGRILIVAQDGSGHFSTIQAALDIAQPSDTIQVKTGVYAESLQITRSGTPTQPITLVNYPGHSPIITPAGAGLPTVAHRVDVNAEWIILEGFAITNGWDGIRVSRGHNTLRHNAIYSNHSHGILVRSAGDLLIEDNTINDNGVGADHHGISLTNPSCLSMANVTIRQNTISNSSSAGLQAKSACPESAGITDALIENNLFENNSSELVLQAGFNNSMIRNNTIIHILLPLVVNSAQAIFSFQKSMGNVVTNNIIHIESSAATVYPLETHSATDEQRFDANLWSVPANTAWYWQGALYTDFNSQYRALTGYDTHDLFAEPKFVDLKVGDYHLSALSPARNTGAAECAATDKEGTTRPQEAVCDIGAYEFLSASSDTGKLAPSSGSETGYVGAKAASSSLVSSLSAASTQSTTQGSSVTSGLLAHLTFDDGAGTTAQDASGNGNTGTLVNGPSWTTGKVGGALSFDGINDYVNLSDFDAQIVAANRVTYVAWVNLVTNLNMGIIGKLDYDNGLTYERGKIWFYTRGSTSGWNWKTKQSLPLNTWTHIAAVYDGTRKRLYINGVEKDSIDFSDALTNTTNSFTIGRIGTNVGFLRGLLDDVRVYSRALSSQEIQDLYNLDTQTQDTTPPVLSNGSPSDTLPSGTTQTTLSLTTDENATCRYATTAGTSYASMVNTFSNTGGVSHSTLISGLQDGRSYTYYVRCQDSAGNANTDDLTITFSIASLPTQSPSSPTGLLAHWQFDEGSGTTAQDASGNGNTGTLVNGPTWTTGKVGGALSFDGVNDYVLVDNPAKGTWNGDYTVALWVKAASTGQAAYRAAFSNYKNFGIGSTKDSLQLDVDGGGPGNYRVYTDNASRSMTPVTTGWQFLTITLSGTTLKAYNNGVLTNTYTLASGESNTFRDYLIGVNRAGAAYFQGLIDEVRVYNRALSGLEVQELSNAVGASSPSFDFSLSHSGDPSVTQGSSVTNTITATLASGTAQSVSFSASGLPAGVTASFSSPSCTPTCSTTLTLTTSSSTPAGTYTITATGSGSGVIKTMSFNLTVDAPLSGNAPSSGLLAHWTFDEGSGTTAQDASGNGNIATLVNGPTWATGKVGGALSFDGVNDYVLVDNPTGGTWKGDYTVILWIKAASTGQDPYRSVFNNYKNFGVGGTTDSLQIDVNGGSPRSYRVYANPDNSGSIITPVTTDWQFVTTTLSGTTLKTYNNGILTGTYILASGESNTFRDYVIGTNRGGAMFFNGLVDEVRVYNRALSATEVQALYSAAGTSPSWNSSFDFFLSASGNLSITSGSSVTNTITATLASGTAQSVSFSVSGLPSGVTASFSSPSCTPTCSTTLTLTTSAATPIGTYPITVTGNGGGVIKTTSFNLTIQQVITSGIGSVLIERLGEHSTQGRATAPYATTWVDSQSKSATNPNIYASLSSSSYMVYTSDVIGLVEQAGTCSYAIGGTECVVTSFPLVPTCNGTFCSVTAAVSGGQVTKVAFKYIGVYEGFGAQAVGGKNGTVYRVTNLNDSGLGSLRDAVSQPNRYVVFDVSGVVALSLGEFAGIAIARSNITVDGFTASPPGITLRNSIGITSTKTTDTHDVIIRGLRVRKNGDGGQWAIWVVGQTMTTPVHDFVIDHNSVSGANDDQVAFAVGSYNGTVSWNVIANPMGSHQNFIMDDSKSKQVTIHHNFFAPYAWRNPNISYSSTETATDLTADVRNNLILMGGSEGPSRIGTVLSSYSWLGSKVNFVNNYYIGLANLATYRDALSEAIRVYTGSNYGAIPTQASAGAWVDGNVAVSAYNPPPVTNINSLDYLATAPFAAPAVTTTDAFTAACEVAAISGAPYRDAIDQNWIDNVKGELAKFGKCAATQ